jgi:NAD(P)-dependent dehydrogenase (short-subunit alcohol dehydrogenase family)
VKKVGDEVGPVDVLVNNAGITRDMTFKKMDKANWDAVMKTNLDSCFNMTKQVVDSMAERGWGRIINISSVNGQKGAFGQTNYFRGQGGHAWLHQGAGSRIRAQGRDVEHHLARLHRNQDGDGDPEGSARQQDLSADPMVRLGKPEENRRPRRLSRERGSPRFLTVANIRDQRRPAHVLGSVRAVAKTGQAVVMGRPVFSGMSMRALFFRRVDSAAPVHAQQPTPAASAIRDACRRISWRIGEVCNRAAPRRRVLAQNAAKTSPRARGVEGPSRRDCADAAKPAAAVSSPGIADASGTWPHTVRTPNGTATIYQPQVVSWPEHRTLDARVAIGVTPTGAAQPILGTLDVAFDSRTELAERSVVLTNGRLVQARFPSAESRAIRAHRRAHQGSARIDGEKRVPIAAVVLGLREGAQTPTTAPRPRLHRPSTMRRRASS